MSNAKYLFLSFAALALCLSLGFLAAPVYAGENFNNHYAGGNEDFMAGALPPPGTNIFLNYLVDYNTSGYGGLRDQAGRKAATTPLVTPGASLPVKADFNVLVDALRFVRVTKISLLGGDLVLHTVIPFGNVHASAYAVTPDGGTAYPPSFPSSSWSLADITVGAGIAWHPSKTFHHVFAIDAVAPTGTYQASNATPATPRFQFYNEPSNLGRNYWSFNPLWAFTYLGDETSPVPGLELSAKLMYWINTVNTATSYVSGQEFSADYLVGYHLNKKWAVGANGYYLYQTTDDKQFGKTAIDPLTGIQTGMRGRTFSIGPAIRYELPKGCITFKYQHDVYSQNRLDGDKFWLRFIWTF